MAQEGHELEDVDVQEISGVRSPANRKRRWLLMKREEVASDVLAELEKELTEGEVPVEKDVKDAAQAVQEALGKLEPYKDDIPDDVWSAVEKVREWAGRQGFGYPPPYGKERKSDGAVKALIRAIGHLILGREEEAKAMTEKTEQVEKDKGEPQAKEAPQPEPWAAGLDELGKSMGELGGRFSDMAGKLDGMTGEVGDLKKEVTGLSERLEALERARGVRKSLDGQDATSPPPKMGEGLFANVLGFGARE